MYFVIITSADGLYIRPTTAADVQQALADPEEWNNPRTAVLTTAPGSSDPAMWVPPGKDRAVLIIRGEVVTPRPVEVITRYEL